MSKLYEFSWVNYLNKVNKYFRHCENKSVMEIGPFEGRHSDVILTYNPTKLTLIEPAPEAAIALRNRIQNCEIIEDDVYKYVETKRDFDVVVCCGVLYHFHSPLYLLEQIANNVNPEYMIIESTFNGNNMYFHTTYVDEIDNIGGNRYTNGKSVKMTNIINENVLLKAMVNLEYELIESEDVSVDDNYSKSQVKMFVFKRK